MKERFFIKASMADKITYYHLLVFAMALPFDRLYSELALISLAVHTVIHIRKADITRNRLSAIFIPAAIYFLTVLATAYTHFYGEAFYEWERQLAILLFPLIILYNSFDFKKYRLNILLALAISCFLTILYLYYNAYYIIRFNHLPLTVIFSNAFINHNFSAPIDMHATYFSMYIALGAVALVYSFVNSQSRKEKWIFGILFAVLLAGLLQLSSRAVLIAFLVIINIAIPLLLYQKKKRVMFAVVSVLFSLVILFTVTRIDNLKARFIVDLKEDLTLSAINNNIQEPRIQRWECAWELIKQSPLYGHGSGSEIVLLKDIYFTRKLYNSYINELNAHNQYLSMLIKTGVIGLFVLLYIFIAGFRQAIRSRDVLFCGFLVIVASVSFSENILDANKGIFFFAFFFSLFYQGSKKEEMAAIQK